MSAKHKVPSESLLEPTRHEIDDGGLFNCRTNPLYKGLVSRVLLDVVISVPSGSKLNNKGVGYTILKGVSKTKPENWKARARVWIPGGLLGSCRYRL